MASKDNINNKREYFIWKLLIDSGFLIFDLKNEGLKIRNKATEIFIKEKFSEWKTHLFDEYKDIINYFIKNYDEEKIKEFLEDSMKNVKNQDIYLNKYYDLILALLSLKEGYVVITKNTVNKNNDIRELLVINKEYLDIFINNNSNDIIKNDNSKLNKNKNNISSDYSHIIYITIKKVNEERKIDDGCILALEDNENFKFDDIKLKDLYDKIIKFGIAFHNEKCNVIYEINYGVHFKRKEMPKEIYTGEKFHRFNTNKFYFIDKTRMISKLIGQDDAVFLITRPRRFGKSLNLRMIKEFFEKPNNVENDGIDTFDGLEISKDRKNMREFHKYPVIFLNLKDNSSKKYESIVESLKIIISNLFKYHRKNIDFNVLGENEQRKWFKIENEIEDISLLGEYISFLMECLNKFYKRNCIVLIDEYDNILTNCLDEEYFDKIYDCFKSIFSNIFKSNDNLYFGIATGCLNLAFNSLFSGVNNFSECSQLYDACFSDCYGFTEGELNNIMSHFDIPIKLKNDIKEEYDGYSCGVDDNKGIIKNLYNPYSIMKFIYNNRAKKEKYELDSYWVKYGKNTIIRTILKSHDYVFEIDFLSVLYGNTIIVKINKNLDLNSKPFNKDDLWTLLLLSGYLTAVDREEYEENVNLMDNQITKLLLNKHGKSNIKNSIQNYKDELKKRICPDAMKYVRIPNNEVKKSFVELLKSTIGSLLDENNHQIVESYIKNFVEGIFEKDINKINKNLNDYLMIFSSYHLFKRSDTYENVYQVLLMQLFIFWKVKGLTAEEESGYGRYDIGFPSRQNSLEYILIEVKVYNMNEEENGKKKKNNGMNKNAIDKYLHKECIDAINQIEQRKYHKNLMIKGYKNFTKYGIAFYKKECRVEMKINEDKIQSPSKNNDNSNDNNNDDGNNNNGNNDCNNNNNDINNDNNDDNDNNNRKKNIKKSKITTKRRVKGRGRGRGRGTTN